MADASPTVTTSNSFIKQLRDGEQHWAWKFGLRVIICVADIVGIGCAAWLASEFSRLFSPYNYVYGSYFDYAMLPGSLTAMSVSLIWCLICILIYLLRRPPSPVHPGIAVGIDLILWLGLIITGLFAVAAVIVLAQFGANHDYLEDPSYSSSYDGHYSLAANGTWVYHVTYNSNSCEYTGYGPGCHYNYTTGSYTSNSTARSVKRDCGGYFDSCVEQDAYVNMLWKTKSKREATEIVIAAVQWLGVLLHFTLFVWACVDTHRRNHGKKARDDQAIADRIIQDMQARGLFMVQRQDGTGAETAEVTSQSGQAPNPNVRDFGEIGQAR